MDHGAIGWSTQIFMSSFQFALGFPVHIVGTYTDQRQKWIFRITTAIRLVLLYACVALVLVADHTIPPAVTVTLGVGTGVMYGIEWTAYDVIRKSGGLVLPDTADVYAHIRHKTLYMVCASDPINYALDTTSVARKDWQFVLHVVTSIIRISFVGFIVIIATIWTDYERAWGCYQDGTTIDHYNTYCPAYTHDYFNNFQCASDKIYDETSQCKNLRGASAAWQEKPPVYHVAIGMAAHMYAVHVVRVFFDYKRLVRMPTKS